MMANSDPPHLGHVHLTSTSAWQLSLLPKNKSVIPVYVLLGGSTLVRAIGGDFKPDA